ncbi:MAG: chalcone isomerase [Gemmataceae bacterium]|nr:chalcone isomerase [Gemmataceae bacterium]
MKRAGQAFAFLALSFLVALSAKAGETVGVAGSGVRFTTQTDYSVNGKPLKLNLTGTAMRTKFLVNVYAIGSYVQEGVRAKTADDIVSADCLKQLHLVMERAVNGRDMASNFRASILMNHKEEEFSQELATLETLFQKNKVNKGDQVKLTHIPGVGIHCHVIDKMEVTIKGVKFSQAIWEIYLGKQNLGDDIKKNLVSR